MNKVLIATGLFAACLGVMQPALANRSAFATADENPTRVTKVGDSEVRCVDPHACCAESKKVIEELEEMVSAYTKGDMATYEKYLDDKCSFFDESTHKLISGKDAALEHLRESFVAHAPGGTKPLVSFTIDQPFAKVTNDTCVVTFLATKVIGGKNPHTERCHVTDVFVKRGDMWKKLSWSGKWVTVE